MASKTINSWLEYWDEKIRSWYSNPQESFEKSLESKYYRGKGVRQIDYKALPEPYIGNPNNNSAVILNMNPGPVMDSYQNINDGSFITEGKAHLSYSMFALGFPYLTSFPNNGGSSFWRKRQGWIKRLLKHLDKTTEKYPFAMEIFPWHSSKFGTIKYSEEYLTYIDKNVFEIAEAALDNSDLPVILSVSKQYLTLFEKLKFQNVLDFGPEYSNGLEWPQNQKGNNSSRYYSLWKSPRGKLYLNTWSVGSNIQPSEKWSVVEKYILNHIDNPDLS